ncbi:MAG: cation:proton antiporter [Prolixibacteraceae bacterium]|jgi:Kef-type K+ transport system membrane component KefB/nucleotide-binding universal stress UspA family protein|nr:cation:proton antiporter [Prolixibacteraceae bacterium]MDI9564974.1 cation:proton antiporter [Bacteroidota bacterium]NLS99565.1 cation:proton antiporter [Bacteroidales bacterium]OQB82035.1 MAG: Glutathione-regulated potassium-efflux system protein KefC [Bacteroidetes bacterium ADurb.Bin123]HNZ69720.1 cation:proton antiporter [Prolixibacteraceae bacterium]
MVILNIFNITLPLTNPVLIFSLILFIILFSPVLLNRLSIPPLVGLIIAGAVFGPNGLNLIARDSSIELFGTVGLLYLMFISSMEMDMNQFRRNSLKSLVFGIFTFVVPMLLGILSGVFLLRLSMVTAVLLASMYASNTLITYPIVSRLGIIKNRAVNVSVGATIITTLAALLVLAVIVRMHNGGTGILFWVRLVAGILISFSVIFFVFPLIARWFMKRYDDNVAQYILVLGLVFMGAFLAQLGGIEPILGAFITGLALNRLIPNTSPLMNRIDFVGNALFIPFFLISVGMLIDFRIFFSGTDTLVVATVMTVVATLAKYLAALLSQKAFRFGKNELLVMFGLTNSQAASTLAAVLIGYNIIIGYTSDGLPVRLLNENILNGTVVMILVTCTIASFATQRGARGILLDETSTEEPEVLEREERILIPFRNSETVEELVHLSVTVASAKNHSRLLGLHIIDDLKYGSPAETEAQALMEKAEKSAAATDHRLTPIIRYDTNAVNGIVNVIRENKITDLILGMHHKKGFTDSYLGTLTQGILNKCDTTTLIYSTVQPLATIRRYLVFVPDHAEKEIGFVNWLAKLWNIGKNTGARLHFYSSKELADLFSQLQKKHPVAAEFIHFPDWEKFSTLSREVKTDDCLVFVLSRRNYPSFHHLMDKVPEYLDDYFEGKNFILIYPRQTGLDSQHEDLSSGLVFDPLSGDYKQLETLLKTIGRLITRR